MSVGPDQDDQVTAGTDAADADHSQRDVGDAKVRQQQRDVGGNGGQILLNRLDQLGFDLLVDVLQHRR